MPFDHSKYAPYHPIDLPDRSWPDKRLEAAPKWCSVDLRDGNQALIEPMTVEQKHKLFSKLLEVGFKEIEIGFPAASQPDFDFCRELIEGKLIPEDVTVQVLTQARPELIARSFEALRGAKRAIVHVYNSTSTVQRQQVFQLDKYGIKEIAVNGANWVADHAEQQAETDWVFQYSPESFTGTEPEFAVEVCNAVIDTWKDRTKNPIIINLPATVEMNTPNVYADQIEWMCRHLNHRERVEVSLHTHNDRGCGVAAAELGVLAGADRVEGTLLGNGERTGNMDVVTMAMNLYSRGIDPELNFEDMDGVVATVQECTNLPVHPRHPWAGDLVFTAFSGSHQDAIRKCMQQYRDGDTWEVAYLPIDPKDIGRDYQAVIRVNSQSGKGGVAWMLEQNYGVSLPRWMQIELSREVQQAAESSASELSAEEIWQLFESRFLKCDEPWVMEGFELKSDGEEDVLQAHLRKGAQVCSTTGRGSGAMESFVNGLYKKLGIQLEILDYSEHATEQGAESQAVAFVHLNCDGQRQVAAAMHRDIVSASLNAVLHGLNRYLQNNPDIEAA